MAASGMCLGRAVGAEHGLWDLFCRMWDAREHFSRGCVVTLAVGGGEQRGTNWR